MIRHAHGAPGRRPTPASTCTCRADHIPMVERQVIALYAGAVPLGKIAAELGYAEGTVATYLNRARARLGAVNRPHLVTLAFRDRLIGFNRDGRVVVVDDLADRRAS